MKVITTLGLLAVLPACRAPGDPIQPNVGLGIGPGGIKPRVSVAAKGEAGAVTLSPGGLRASPAGLPLSVGL